MLMESKLECPGLRQRSFSPTPTAAQCRTAAQCQRVCVTGGGTVRSLALS